MHIFIEGYIKLCLTVKTEENDFKKKTKNSDLDNETKQETAIEPGLSQTKHGSQFMHPVPNAAKTRSGQKATLVPCINT
jgi:hypothetical protein